MGKKLKNKNEWHEELVLPHESEPSRRTKGRPKTTVH